MYFVLYSEIRTNLSYGHPLIPRHPDKRGLTVHDYLEKHIKKNSKLDVRFDFSTTDIFQHALQLKREFFFLSYLFFLISN